LLPKTPKPLIRDLKIYIIIIYGLKTNSVKNE